VPVLAVKLTVVAAAGTATETGRVRMLGMAPEMATNAPPVGAALFKMIVQVVLAFEESVAGAHCSDEINEEGTREITALLEEPFKAAVTVAL
jgi:hypothetical protein